MFLAEVDISGDAAPVFLDDPSCSLDQEGRRHIARALCGLAESRQVIVLTHELMLVVELRRAARYARTEPHVQHMVRLGRSAGIVRPDLPWEGLEYTKRTGVLETKVRPLADLHATGDRDAYKREAEHVCNYFRQSFERAVEDGVFGGCILRGDDAVHTQKLKDVVCTPEIEALVDRGLGEYSPWVHDRSRVNLSDPPTPSEFEEGIRCFRDLVKVIAREKDRIGKARTARKKAARQTLIAAETAPAVPPEGPGTEITVSDARATRE
jgi:hypothetical protein